MRKDEEPQTKAKCAYVFATPSSRGPWESARGGGGKPQAAAVGEASPAASPLAVRKGSAFPLRNPNPEPHLRRLEGSAFKAAQMGRNHAISPGKPEAFRRAGGRAVSSTPLIP